VIDTRTAILQALMQGESYGLGAIDRVRKMSGGKIKLMQGCVYPVLRELEAGGFLRSSDGDPLAEQKGRTAAPVLQTDRERTAGCYC